MLITLSNPGKLNATDATMHAELSTDLRRHPRQSRGARRGGDGEGKAFSAGGDLDWIAEQVGNYERDDACDAARPATSCAR